MGNTVFSVMGHHARQHVQHVKPEKPFELEKLGLVADLEATLGRKTPLDRDYSIKHCFLKANYSRQLFFFSFLNLNTAVATTKRVKGGPPKQAEKLYFQRETQRFNQHLHILSCLRRW